MEEDTKEIKTEELTKLSKETIITDDESEDNTNLDEENHTDKSESEEESKDESTLEEETIVEDNKTDEENKNIEEEPDQKTTNNKKKTILLIVIIVLLLIAIGCIVYLTLSKKNNNKPEDNISKVTRPENVEYTVLKQNYFGMSCKTDKNDNKYKALTKGLVIKCSFNFDVYDNQKVSELYFDLNNSQNVKLLKKENKKNYKIENEGNTYKITFDTPNSALEDELFFYFEVINQKDKTGFVEVKDVIYKDENDKYYKIISTIEVFPPEYDDKIYIYKDTYDDDGKEEVYYFSSKNKIDAEEYQEYYGDNVTLFDTFQCKNEECESYAENENYFLINDDKLLIYDTLKKTTNEIKTPDKFDIETYSFDIVTNSKNNLYGLLFKKNYTSSYACDYNANPSCVNSGLSGYEVGYYSIKAGIFTIDLDYGFVGNTVYTDYTTALLLKKDNKYGVFSFEEDDMILELTDKYNAIEYDDMTESVALQKYDEKYKINYFEFFNLKDKNYKLDIKKLNKYKETNIYYIEKTNSERKVLTMLFDKNGSPLKDLPYLSPDYKNAQIVENEIRVDDMNKYYFYDFNGNYLYSYTGTLIEKTKSYLILFDNKDVILADLNGKTLLKIFEPSETMTFISAEEENNIVTITIKDTAITEENKNAYKYTIKDGKTVTSETIYVE